ncbi:MAG: 4Fe-4S binding protein [Prevotella sp.]|nr:4Fe-4S binding protein [Prevotella sp.]
MKQKAKHWYDYMWIVSATYFTLGFFNIVFAWLGLICFAIPLIISLMGGGKLWCNSYCGRGQIFMLLGKTLHLSPYRKTPRWLSSKWFRHGFLIFFMSVFIHMVYVSVLVGKGMMQLEQSVRLLWTFDVPWHWAYPMEIEAGRAQFAFGLYGIMMTSLILGIILTLLFRPRTWCVFCPMGNMTQLISKAKNRK